MKKILILNGNPKEDHASFDDYIGELAQQFGSMGAEVHTITLRQKNIADCIGCYSCWLKTPGVCPLKDDQEEVLKGYVWADLAVLASPMIMGFVSALAKKIHDRMLPMVHPFLRIDKDRMTHYPRYEKTAKVGVVLDQASTSELEMIGKVYGRAEFVKTMERPAKEVANEIYNI